MAYKFETRAISARIYEEVREKCRRLGVNTNRAANYGLKIFVKALQRNTFETETGIRRDYFYSRVRYAVKSSPTSLRIRHDLLVYIEIQGLNRNKIINNAIDYVCEEIKHGRMSINVLTEGPNGYGIARRNVYTKSDNSGKEGQEP